MPQENPNKAHAPCERGLIAEGTTAVDIQHNAVPDWASLIIEGIDEVFFSVDREWRFTYLNRQAGVVLGQPPAALIGQVVWEAFPSLIGSNFEQLYRQAMDDGKPGRLEDFSATRQSWYDVRTYPIPQGLLVYFQDVTARKLVEAEIQHQSVRARVQAEVSRTLAEATHDYQTTLDTAARQLADIVGDACIIRLTADDSHWLKLAAAYHTDPDVITFMREVLTSEHYQRVTEGLTGRVIQTGQPVRIPVISSEELKATTDPRHWDYLNRFTLSSVLIVPLRAVGSAIGVVTMLRNTPGRPYTDDDQTLLQDLSDRVAIAITNARLFQQIQNELDERTRVEIALQASEERFRALIEHSPDAIALFSIEGTILYGSPTTTRMLGYPLDQFVGRSAFDLIHPDDHALVAEQLIKTTHDPLVSVPVHARVRHHDGSWRFLEGMFTNLLDNPSVGAIINNYRDVTERKQSEEALRKAQAQLIQSQKMESMGQLAGGIAHDFNNLLTVIIGYCDIMMTDLHEADPQYPNVLEIQKAGNRAANLVRQILAFSRQQVLEPKVVNLNDAVANLETLLYRVLGADIVLVLILDPQLAHVLVDPSQIEQVIVNLTVNARDAMPDGGQLTIETATVELDEHYRSTGHPTVKTGTYVMLAVSDTGIGMDLATQEQIFEPFFTTKAPGKGTGLGLATVYGIVRQSEGYIWTYSAPGVGTTLKVYIPIIEDQTRVPSQGMTATEPQRAAQAPSIEQSGHGRTILVVEDDRYVRDFVERVLGQAGYTILEAYNGQEALNVLTIAGGQVDIVLTDMVMPEMGGRTLVERIREQWADLKILCMSGYTDRAVQRQSTLWPNNTILPKPFTPTMLLRRLDEVLNEVRDQ